MSALLSEKNVQKCINSNRKRRHAVQYYLDKYTNPEIELQSYYYWNSNEADAINRK